MDNGNGITVGGNIDRHLEVNNLSELPPSAWAIYLALVDAYGRSGAAVEVFTGSLNNGRSSMRVRPSNVRGHLEFIFDAHGRIDDVLWDSHTGPPPREGDQKT